MKTQKRKHYITKRLDQSDPDIFNRVAEYLLKLKKEKEDRNNKMIIEHFGKCLK